VTKSQNFLRCRDTANRDIDKTNCGRKTTKVKKLKGSAKKYLRGQAHHLRPVVIVGAKGISDTLLASIDAALQDHELIKVKFGEFKEAKKEISQEIAKATKSELVGLIGNVAIFYRQQADPQKRKIEIF